MQKFSEKNHKYSWNTTGLLTTWNLPLIKYKPNNFKASSNYLESSYPQQHRQIFSLIKKVPSQMERKTQKNSLINWSMKSKQNTFVPIIWFSSILDFPTISNINSNSEGICLNHILHQMLHVRNSHWQQNMNSSLKNKFFLKNWFLNKTLKIWFKHQLKCIVHYKWRSFLSKGRESFWDILLWVRFIEST